MIGKYGGGPLAGVRVLELGGKGPVPLCGMMLGDLGAEVIRVDRPGEVPNPVLNRNRRSISLDLKSDQGVGNALRLVRQCDVVLEGFRPGVLERMGLSPERMLEANSRLVIGRMTGWGQDGPWAASPGHDINYIARNGVLHAIGTPEQPVVPLNLVADMGGGGMLLAVGVLAACLEARTSGRGQTVDAAMVDGSATLMAMMYGFLAQSRWCDERAVNRLDGAAPYYTVYACSDGHVAVGCVEPQFWRDFLELMGVAEEELFRDQENTSSWLAMKERLAELFARRTREEWSAVFPRGRACVTPVLSMTEAFTTPENEARGVFDPMPAGGHWPSPSPRFARTPAPRPTPARAPGEDTANVLSALGDLECSDGERSIEGVGAGGD